MEIRDLAEAVLFSDRFEDKLVPPEDLSDRRPGPALARPPEAPGRPARLRLDRGEAPRFPGPGALERPEGRGLALHFFANHELLAMELMALVLLRFPDAPPAFRMDLARTIGEEQDHLRMYQARMADLGVGLGDAPVNAFFWRTMRDAPTPLSFVVQMALTFEQANLDYCVHYRDRFVKVGDAKSADLLEQVYQDEVGHVRAGVRWFDRWRDEDKSDWEAYVEALPFPLTPARAKGPVFDVKGRRRAGLSEAFVRRLRVCSGSKGRRPRLFVFAPGMEDALAGRKPPRSRAVEELARDLAPLMGLLGRPDDQLWLDAPPSLEHEERLAQAGLELPEVVTAPPSDPPPERLVPWGFTPQLAERARALSGQDVPLHAIRRASSKLWARDRLSALLDARADDPALGARADLEGWAASAPAEVDDAMARAWARGLDAVVKAPFSASGRHRVRSQGGRLDDGARRWVERAIEADGAVWVAPWLPRVRDFGLPFTVTESGAKDARLLWLDNDDRGAYRGHVLAPPAAELGAEARRALNQGESLVARARAVADHVARALFDLGYTGPAGVDLFAYRDVNGQVRLHPLVEVNVRYTMGHVAARLAEALAAKTAGVFRQIPARALEGETFAALGARLEAAHPVRRDEGGLRAGVVCLNDPAAARQVLAVLSVAPDPAAARAALEG